MYRERVSTLTIDEIGVHTAGLSRVNINQLPNSIYNSTDLTLLNAVRLAPQNYRPYTNYGTITQNGNHNLWGGQFRAALSPIPSGV